MDGPYKGSGNIPVPLCREWLMVDEGRSMLYNKSYEMGPIGETRHRLPAKE